MPSLTRRTYLATAGSALGGALAGCTAFSNDDGVPAGALQFVNDHGVPHEIQLRVVDVGTAVEGAHDVTGDPIVPPSQRQLTASAVVEPGETRTYDAVFTEPVWYEVRFTLDDERPENDAGHTAFNPAPNDDGRASYLTGRVYPGGDFSWVISATDDSGSFD
ncbi:hypothetical protein [Salarchaeum sp. JOR-1]|uniref:hypothetical protein n=1 Tax=Salarchaeum sp. JOR-1 TaxID=2599399 RepID=UPI0011983AE8|nr:hypothetical protein [Salarchaeum sp. JOR-1]QDX41323.1 hypothetical protein FQU85_10600 [Salarchaeum sp. JOR-1]